MTTKAPLADVVKTLDDGRDDRDARATAHIGGFVRSALAAAAQVTVEQLGVPGALSYCSYLAARCGVCLRRSSATQSAPNHTWTVASARPGAARDRERS